MIQISKPNIHFSLRDMPKKARELAIDSLENIKYLTSFGYLLSVYVAAESCLHMAIIGFS